tara:strand:- start:30 stop:995 length:966 start_codon:yes stop_codon:yes gene_type:complete
MAVTTKGRSRFLSYRYPNKMLTESTDYLKIQIKEYIPLDHDKSQMGGPGEGGTNGKEGRTHSQQTLADSVRSGGAMQTVSSKVKKAKSLAQIILPMPQSITDNNGVTWNNDEMNPLQTLGAKVGKNLMTGGLQGAKDALGIGDGTAQNLGTISESEKQMVFNALSGMAVGKSANDMVSRTTGKIMNPNLEVIFGGVELRGFTFTFAFAPRNMSEANQVKQIIRLFKKHSAAKFESGNGFYIASPDIFTFEYMKGRSAHPFLNVFKPMVINKIDTDYTGNGTYSTYPDGTPTFIKMTLNVQEMNPIYAEHYDDGEGKRGVGF